MLAVLAFREFGSGSPEAVLLLHGAGVNGHQWDQLARDLSDYHCLVPDLPGHGDSLHVSPLTLENTAAALEELCARLPTSKPLHVVGNSLGGSIGLTLLDRQPSRYASLLVSGASAGFSPTLLRLATGASRVSGRLPARRMAARAFRQYRIPRAVRPLFQADMERGVSGDFLANLFTELQRASPPTSLTAILALVGGHEGLLARRSAMAIARQSPHAQAWLVPRRHHVWNLEDPEMFSRVTRRWLQHREVEPGLRRLAT